MFYYIITMFYYMLLFVTSIIFLLRYRLGESHITSYGPASYPIIGCLVSFYQNRHRLLHWYTEIVSQSPSHTMIVKRFGAPRTIVTANPQNVEHILKSNFQNYPKGKPFTELLGDFLGRGIFNADGELWKFQRKFASHEFTARSLREVVVKALEEEVRGKLLPLLQIAAEENKVFDLQDVLSRFAFDIICKVTLGNDPRCLDLPLSVSPLALAFDGASKFSAMRGVAPIPLVWKIKRALNIGSELKLKEAVHLVHSHVNKIIESKKEKLMKRKEQDGDLLSNLLVAGHDDEMVRDMVISFLMAGRDTTSAAMTWFFWLLSKNPGAEKIVVDEIDNVNLGLSPLDYDDLKAMKNIKACLCESMRLYPPVVWDSKHAENDDVLPDGTTVFRGNRVTYFQYGMGRMEEIWGKDWRDFKPERWLDRGTGMMKRVSPYEFAAFQAGPRVCLGKEMAFIQMKYVIASILAKFEIRPVDIDEDPVLVPLLTASMAGGFKVRVHRRVD